MGGLVLRRSSASHGAIRGSVERGGDKVFPWGGKELRSVFFILRQVGVVLHSFILRQVGIVLHFFWVTMGVW